MNIIAGMKFKSNSAIELAKAIEQAYLLQRREDKETTKKTFAPSNIGGYHGTCPRYWFLAFDGNVFTDNKDALSIATMENGTDAHARIQRVFTAAGIVLDEELECEYEDPPIRGYLDLEIEWNGERIVGEIKTTRQEAFEHRAVTGKPSDMHLLQILIYMKIRNTQKGFLFYENRNTQEFLIIPVSMDEKNEAILEDCFEWLRSVRNAWEEQNIPKAVYQKRNKICQACPVLDACIEAPKGELFIPAFGRHHA